MDTLLKVVSIEKKHSEKAGCDFKVVTFKGVKLLPNGREVKTNVSGTRNLWPTHEVEVDGQKTTIKGDVDYDNIMLDDFFDGAVQSFTTTPYELNGRTIGQYRCVVFGHENGLFVAARNLRQNNAAPFDPETGEVVTLQSAGKKAPAKQEAPVLVSAGSGEPE